MDNLNEMFIDFETKCSICSYYQWDIKNKACVIAGFTVNLAICKGCKHIDMFIDN